MTADQVSTIDIFADTRGVARCRSGSCRARIEWAEIVATGKKMCFDDVQVLHVHEDGTGRLIQTVALAKNHWATCPDRERFTRKKA
jgi:hypothetical protein